MGFMSHQPDGQQVMRRILKSTPMGTGGTRKKDLGHSPFRQLRKRLTDCSCLADSSGEGGLGGKVSEKPSLTLCILPLLALGRLAAEPLPRRLPAWHGGLTARGRTVSGHGGL